MPLQKYQLIKLVLPYMAVILHLRVYITQHEVHCQGKELGLFLFARPEAITAVARSVISSRMFGYVDSCIVPDAFKGHDAFSLRVNQP